MEISDAATNDRGDIETDTDKLPIVVSCRAYTQW